MSGDHTFDTKVSTARKLYRALAAGDRDALSTLLHPEFVGHATDGLPLDMGGRHDGPEAMRRNLWWTMDVTTRSRRSRRSSGFSMTADSSSQDTTAEGRWLLGSPAPALTNALVAADRLV
jgi:SnoaL-like domain